MIQFGAGSLFAIPTHDANGAAITTPTPIQFGTLQEVGLDASFDSKKLYGNKQFPIAVARGTFKFVLIGEDGTALAAAALAAGAGMDAKPVEALLGIGCEGIVLAGMGQGNAPAAVLDALAGAAKGGVPVVRASRVDQGYVDRNLEVDDDARGFVAARSYGPAKARILLQLLIASGITDPLAMQVHFDRR